MRAEKHYIGCSGYHYKDWKGAFYPEELKQKEWLTYYSKQFSSVEINNTFYKIPAPGTFRAWDEQTPDDFRFTLKGSRYITHMKKLKDPEEHLKKFYHAMEPLAEKTSCILWQLPGNLHRNTDRLEAFCDRLSDAYRNVIEFRHASWFQEEIFEILEKKKSQAACSLSAPGDLPGDLLVQNGIAYIRFHGKTDWYHYRYSEKELEEWVEQVRRAPGINILYAYFNNDVDAHAPANARMFMELLEK